MKEDLQARLVRDLVTESNESLEEFDRELLLLEKGETSNDALHRMFRVIHSLKGTSGCLGLSRIESLAHAGENLLALLRDGEIRTTPELVNTLLSYADALRVMLAHLDAHGAEGTHDFSALLCDLKLLSEIQSAQPAAPPQPAVFGFFDDEPAEPQPAAPPIVRVVPQPAAAPAPPSPAPNTVSPIAPAETAIRVDVEQLDSMMDLVGELVLARNQLMQFSGKLADPALLNASQRLNLITSKLQETVMKTRMQPIDNIWAKFPRIVRDVSRDLGKDVRLVMEGNDTDLDRNIIEAIKDPLTHLVRNAIDHGLEKPDMRTAAGKMPQGTLRLRAFHEGGQVNIEIHDDGAGIDREKVINKALQKGLVSAAQIGQMSDREILALIFAPGFSTAEKVTNLSGRGVGMDVVKKNIERIGGSVDVQSEAGRWTTIRMKIPLTLAIIPALIIRCAGRRYAIPQVSLVELVRIDSEQSAHKIEYINGSPVYRLRGNLLPLIHLRAELGLPPQESAGDSIFVLVLQAEGKQFGMVVDSICDTEEIVVKPLGKELKTLSAYAGATIMGDGRVALILDVLGIARNSCVVNESSQHSPVLDSADRNQADTDRQSIVVFSLGGTRQAAIPLSHVARLEEFSPLQVEQSATCEVVQYRGEIMPLLRIARMMGLPESQADPDRICVIVYNHHGTSVGLVVDEILDTVEENIVLRKTTNAPGISGSAVVKKRVTDFIDTDSLLQRCGVLPAEVAQ